MAYFAWNQLPLIVKEHTDNLSPAANMIASLSRQKARHFHLYFRRKFAIILHRGSLRFDPELVLWHHSPHYPKEV
jgi:hypothetical protein